MKQALVSLFRTVVGVRVEVAAQHVALPELTVSELRQVFGGASAVDLPKGTW